MSTPERLSTADLATVDKQTPPDAPPNRAESRPAVDRRYDDEPVAPLFATEARDECWRRWDEIQGGFVDEPRHAVEGADTLVAETMKRLAETFSEERSALERQWESGDEVSTEDLRLALRRYRSFFKRLLSV